MEAETINIPTGDEKAPMCVIVIGMAGSGKSTFISVFFFSHYPPNSLIATWKTSKQNLWR